MDYGLKDKDENFILSSKLGKLFNGVFRINTQLIPKYLGIPSLFEFDKSFAEANKLKYIEIMENENHLKNSEFVKNLS